MASKKFSWCGAIAALMVSVTMARADLHFPEPVVDVGEGRCGAPLSHRFGFLNCGSAPVEILDVKASCGCLTPRLAQRVFKSGEKGFLVLEINTLSQEEGPHNWTCQVTCQSAGKRIEIPLQMKGRIIAEVTVRPAVLTIYTDNAAGHELVLTDRRPKPLTLTGMAGSSSRLKPQLLEETRNEQGHTIRRIRLDVAADYPEGRHDEVVTLVTQDALYRELRVPVTVIKRTRPRVTATPAEVASPTQLIRLRDRQDQKVVVETITADDPAITCQWAAGPDTQATLKVRIDPSRLAKDIPNPILRVQISQPVREMLIIPVKFAP